MKLETLEIGTLLRVVKDIYYIIEDSLCEGDFLTYEELMDSVAHILYKGDVYKVIVDEGERMILCVEGQNNFETNDGWFDVNDMLDKGVFEIVDLEIK